MMQQFLTLMADPKPHTLGELSTVLKIPVGMVAMMAEQLQQLGYLETADACGEDAGSCTGCASHAGCLLGAARRVWALTEKGRQAAVAG